MNIKENLRKFWEYLKKDTWDSWLVSIVLIIVLIKFIIFPLLTLATGASLPLVVVESCSMYHEADFNEWWYKNEIWYNEKNISLEDFKKFSFKNGLNKGDIILLWGYSNYKKGDIIIYSAPTKYPIIHRIISENPIETKGDHNLEQLPFEKNIKENEIIGKSIIKIPFLGWVKLIFFEPFKPANQRGFCN